LARDPDAWSAAAELARACGAGGALRFLRAAFDQETLEAPLDRLQGAWRTAAGGGTLRSRLLFLREARRRKALPFLVTFSGLDGSGKSTQVERLGATMRQLGLPTTARRAGLRKGYSVRDALPFLDRRPRGATHEYVDEFMPSICARTAFGRQAWVGVLALANVAHAWRLLLSERRARLVLVDRYVADAAVKFELYYRIRRATPPWLQQRLLATLTPRPLLAFHLDVSVDTAMARRPEEDSRKISGMAPLYDSLSPVYSLIRLDGHREASELADEVATAVWRELSRRPRR
jgi:thymidylate kinase